MWYADNIILLVFSEAAAIVPYLDARAGIVTQIPRQFGANRLMSPPKKGKPGDARGFIPRGFFFVQNG